MHSNSFLKDVQVKIIRVLRTEVVGNKLVFADLITEQFGRRYEKRHVFDIEVWNEIKERGYIE